MVRIINGKRYDTDKATLIGEAEESYVGQFEHWCAGLYITPRSKSYFLAGSGGPMSRFSRPVDRNSWGGGEKIIPMARQEALAWAERYLDPAAIEKHFGDLIEDA